MTHLRIEQNNGVIEEVSSEVIEKLYNIVHDGTLDNTSNLVGRLHTSATYQDYIDYLEDTFKINGVKLLIIDSTNIYIRFNDPVIESYWANSVGDGVGVTTTLALGVTNMPQNVFNNTTVTSFDELALFGITSLPSNCFNGATNLTSINTSKITDFSDGCFKDSGITSINLSSCNDHLGEAIFSGCASLLSVIWPEHSFNMYKSAFNGCTSLLSVDLTYLNNSNANYAIRLSCFSGCTSLTSVIIGTNVKAIDAWAFSNCQSLSSINLSGIETISYSFGGCSSLTSIDLSSCITIGSDAFSGCTNLLTVKLGSNLTTIGSNAFKNCLALTTIDLSNVTGIGLNAFSGCSSLTTVGDTSNVTFIGNYTFNGCSSLTTIDLSSVTTINVGAFTGCSSLTTVDLSSATSIGLNAFRDCSALTTVDLSSVTSISSEAFRNCRSLGTNLILELNLTNQTDNPENPFNGTKYKGLILHWPNAISSWRHNYPLWEGMNLEYLDISDTKWPNQVNKVIWYGNSNIETCILSPDFNLVDYGFFDERHNFKYLILLNPNVVTLNDDSRISRIFRSDYSFILHIYVPDSLVSSYLADANWSRAGDETQSFDLSTRILPLSLLPVGVWKTGLYQSYEPYLSNSSDPAYA